MMHLLLLTTMALPQTGAPSVGAAGWLAGCWSLTQGSRTVREHWLPPDGGTMMGVARTVSGGKTSEYEFLVIREGAEALEYVAKPSGQAEAIFRSTRIDANEMVFENPAHDFPTRIAYARIDTGLLATISGVVNGKPRRIEFRYAAADCAK
jgi:hypothetical protein